MITLLNILKWAIRSEASLFYYMEKNVQRLYGNESNNFVIGHKIKSGLLRKLEGVLIEKSIENV